MSVTLLFIFPIGFKQYNFKQQIDVNPEMCLMGTIDTFIGIAVKISREMS